RIQIRQQFVPRRLSNATNNSRALASSTRSGRSQPLGGVVNQVVDVGRLSGVVDAAKSTFAVHEQQFFGVEKRIGSGGQRPRVIGKEAVPCQITDHSRVAGE